MNKYSQIGIFSPFFGRSFCENKTSPEQRLNGDGSMLFHGRDIRQSQGIKVSRAASFRYVRVGTLLILDLVFLWIIYGLLGQYSSWVQAGIFQPGIFPKILEFVPVQHSVLAQLLGFQLLFVIAGGAYQAKTFVADCQRLVQSLFFAGLAIAFTARFTTAIPQSLAFPTLLFCATFSALALSRASMRSLLYQLRYRGYFRLSAFLISDQENSKSLLNTVKHENCYYIVGAAASSFLDLNARGESIQRLVNLGVDELIIDWNSLRNRRYVLRSLKLAGVKVRVFFVGDSHPFKDLYPKQIQDFGLLALSPNFFVDLDFRVKRVADFICAAVGLLIFSPLYLALAIAIRLDSPGNVFYRQTRIGLQGKPIRVWKFRSMVTNAEKLQKDLENLNENSDGILFKMKDDPRITRVGKFIRRYSLDELPQIFNVLSGEMSLIGPRPLPVRDVQRFSKRYFFVRHDILPGITGLWQVSGRSDIDNFEEAVSLDLEYIENWSLALDLEILFRTFGVILKKSGAY